MIFIIAGVVVFAIYAFYKLYKRVDCHEETP